MKQPSDTNLQDRKNIRYFIMVADLTITFPIVNSVVVAHTRTAIYSNIFPRNRTAVYVISIEYKGVCEMYTTLTCIAIYYDCVVMNKYVLTKKLWKIWIH